MPKIVINEQDLTTTPLRVTNNNVVFVPGFYGEGADCLTVKYETSAESYERITLKNPISQNFKIALSYSDDTSTGTFQLSFQNGGESTSSGWAAPGGWCYDDADTDHTKIFVSWDISTSVSGTINYIKIIVDQTEDAFLVCNNISEFEEKVGKTAQKTNSDITVSAVSSAITNAAFADIDTHYEMPVNFMSANDIDRSYAIAKELLNNGIPVLYYAVAGELSAANIGKLYNELIGTLVTGYGGLEIKDGVFYELRGLGDYAVKYLTTGGYPSFGLIANNYHPLVDQMIYCSSRRGDCTALIDAYNNPDGDHKAFYKAVKAYVNSRETETPTDITTGDPNGTDYEYGNREHFGRSSGTQGYISKAYSTGTMIYPWIDVTMQLTGGEVHVPGSYAYLRALAQSIKQGSDWNAIAGVTRGQIPGFVRLCTNVPLTNTVADYMQPADNVAVNPITYIRPYGERIWGNRTLKDNSEHETGHEPGLTASSFLNIRNAVSDVKKQVYDSCNSLMFEPNTDVLWINFQSKIQPLLDRMKSSEIFSGYKIIHNTSKYPYKLLATIVVYPVYAVEEFEITVQLSNEELIIEG